jgi:NADH-quinone oxidoreductase subunit G
MPKMKIDGVEYEFPDGINVLQACEQVGIHIPHFCYHPALKVAGSCRMCKVEVIQGGRKRIDISCNVAVQDSLEIITDSPAVLTARQMTLEFTLSNHPVDCPICDKAGECDLQDYYFEHGLHESRISEPKRHQHKATDIGKYILHDAERCVLCSRCARFTDEVTKTRELGIFGMGAHEELNVHPGMRIDNDYAGNVVDLCPVGALTDKDFRFKRRVWYLKSQNSICQLCGRGCNVRIDYDDNPFHEPKSSFTLNTHRTKTTEHARIQRIKPRHNDSVNGYWICDAGRYGYRSTDSADRLLTPMIKTDSGFDATDWNTALDITAKGILNASGKGGDKVAIVVSPLLTNEELFSIHRLFREKLEFAHIDHRLPVSGNWYGDDILRTPDSFPNRTGCEWLQMTPSEKGFSIDKLSQAIKDDRISTLVSVLADPREFLDDAALNKLKAKYLIARNLPDDLKAIVDAALPAAAWGEYRGTFTNFRGRIQRLRKAFEPLGDAKPVWQLMVDLSSHLKKPLGWKDFNEVFNAMTKKALFFEGLTWNGIGDLGVMTVEKSVETVK